MKLHNVTGLRDALEQLQTEELQTMLQTELERDTPDPDSVRLILNVLEERENDTVSPLTEQKESAWMKYQKKIAQLQKKPSKRWNVLAKAASVVLIVGILVATIPGQAQAETFWEMLQRWSTSVVEYFSKNDAFVKSKYSFATNNGGLQQVYDAVLELGITEPVVPMWLPEGYEITELTTNSSPVLTGLYTRFVNVQGEIVYKVTIYHGEPAHQYYKDNTHYETYEREGATYNITRNNDRWVVVWTKENIECSMTIDCQEDTLQRILKSIYVMEDK